MICESKCRHKLALILSSFSLYTKRNTHIEHMNIMGELEWQERRKSGGEDIRRENSEERKKICNDVLLKI